MIKKFKNVFLIKELRNKLLFIVFVLAIYRLAASIPLPGIDMERINMMMEMNGFLSWFSMFSGGKVSIVLLGVSPYITASIIMQLLTMISPKMEQMYKEEGEAGRMKFNMITRILTVPLSLIQAFAMISYLNSDKNNPIIPDTSIVSLILIVVVATAGTIFLMWLGEVITEKGLGNGTSILIFAGIVSGFPSTVTQVMQTFDSSNIFSYLVFIVVIFVTILGVVFITEGQRIIPISYARRMRGGSQYGGSKTHLPLKVNQAGVIPIIFAVSLVMFPRMIGGLMGNSANPVVHNVGTFLVTFFSNQLYYGLVYFALVTMFTYFYTAVVFDPQKIADNLQRQGGYIQGVRPGKETMEYLGRIVNRITLAGALFLGLIAVLPLVVQGFFVEMSFISVGGSSILIVVSVVIELIKQIDSQLIMRDYDRL